MPALTAAMGFDEACAKVVAYLQVAVPMGSWCVNRIVDGRQLYLEVSDDTYGMANGGEHAYADSLCQYMVAGSAPHVAPTVAEVPLYAGSGAAQTMAIGSYVGFPIHRSDGDVFGTLCALDPATGREDLLVHEPLIGLLSMLLATVLEADLARTELRRIAEHALSQADTDALTGIYNRRAWDRHLAVEEDRYRRFGDAGSVVILDLDRLKTINDTFGHGAGDDHLRLAARVLADGIRPYDVVARLGGDEFGIIAGRTSPAETALLVERLQLALASAGVAGSFGHAPYTIVAGFPGAWAAADAAMYDEKRRRRGAIPAT